MASAKCSSTCLLSGASTPANAEFHVSIDRRCFETEKMDEGAILSHVAIALMLSAQDVKLEGMQRNSVHIPYEIHGNGVLVKVSMSVHF